MGAVKSFNLKPGGDKIPVTKQNRKGESTVCLWSSQLMNEPAATMRLSVLPEPASCYDDDTVRPPTVAHAVIQCLPSGCEIGRLQLSFEGGFGSHLNR